MANLLSECQKWLKSYGRLVRKIVIYILLLWNKNMVPEIQKFAKFLNNLLITLNAWKSINFFVACDRAGQTLSNKLVNKCFWTLKKITACTGIRPLPMKIKTNFIPHRIPTFSHFNPDFNLALDSSSPWRAYPYFPLHPNFIVYIISPLIYFGFANSSLSLF